MRDVLAKPILGLLLHDHMRQAGQTVIQGKEVSWTEGYVINLLNFQSTRGDVRKYVVEESSQDKVAKTLSNVGWGALLSLQLDKNRVVNVDVLCDWSLDVPIDI